MLPRRLEQTVDRVLGFAEEAKSLGFEAGSTLLESLTLPADAGVAAALKLEPDTPVRRITRLRTADGAPLALQVAHLPPPYAALPEAALSESGSLYRALAEHYDLVARRARQTVSARQPSPFERELLSVAARCTGTGLGAHHLWSRRYAFRVRPERLPGRQVSAGARAAGTVKTDETSGVRRQNAGGGA